MKRLPLLVALLLAGATAFAQTETGARASVSADYKIRKGLHLSAEEEMRIDNNFGSVNSFRTGVQLSYKYRKAVKLGVGYTLINPFKAAEKVYYPPRHRFYADITGYLPLGNFQLSLKERLQYTLRTGEFNVYQNTPGALALKSKLTLKYKGWRTVEPYAAFELRTALNDPWGTISGSSQTNSSGRTYYVYTPAGYSHIYNNRYRADIGAEIQFDKRHSLTPYLLIDSCSDYEIDTNKEGTRLFSAAYVASLKLSLCLSYTYSF